VLKRRSDALRDHDRIYALIRSVAIGHNSDDPTRIFLRASERAGIPVRTIGLIEADGSGISSQENREIDMIHRLWGEHKPGGPLVGIGSVKGNVGHTLRAAMAAGVAKAALALHNRVLPPQLPSENPIESLSNLGSSVYLLNEARPWITGDSSNPRRAAVMGANFDAVSPSGQVVGAGRSAVVILEEEPEVRE
jgi:acyl transferase domain-containing protein